MNNKLIIGGDHAGYSLKSILADGLKSTYEITDVGTNSEESCDYPDFAHQVGQRVDSGEFERGIVICGSANGVAMVVNKYPNVRAGLCWNIEIAELARQHNNMNVLCLPARYISKKEAEQIIQTFLNTPFEGGRHEKRVNKIPIHQ